MRSAGPAVAMCGWGGAAWGSLKRGPPRSWVLGASWVAAQTELFPMGAHTLDPWPPGGLSQCVVILKTIIR